MSAIKGFFTLIIYQPLYNALIAIYNIIPDLGITIIILTLIIRLLLNPVAKKSIESQKKLQEIQPEVKKVQEKYKNDKQKQGQAIMELYKKNNVNPTSGCLPLIIQLIFLIALYRVFMAGLSSNGDGSLLYSFISNPGTLNPIAFGFLDITKPNFVLAVVAAILQFFQTRMMMATNKKPKNEQTDKEPDFSTLFQQQMMYAGPIITLIIGIQFPSGLILYWAVTTLYMIVQQYFVFKKEKKLANLQK